MTSMAVVLFILALWVAAMSWIFHTMRTHSSTRDCFCGRYRIYEVLPVWVEEDETGCPIVLHEKDRCYPILEST